MKEIPKYRIPREKMAFYRKLTLPKGIKELIGFVNDVKRRKRK